MSLPFAELPFLAGLVLSWSLAAPPGPANALIAQEAARCGFGAGVLTGLGAVTGDLLMFLLMGVGLLALAQRVPALTVILSVVGMLLMAYFAWEAYRAAGRPDALRASGRGSFGRSFLTVVTSPFNWGWWITVGANLFAQFGPTLLVGFFVGLTAWVGFWSGLARAGATRIRRFAEIVGYASALTLAVFALLLGVAALQGAGLLSA